MLLQPFSVIPVMDLMQGQVVHAVRGQRQQYQPLQSQLCKGSEPQVVMEALLALYPFEQFYIADLDAITHAGSQHRSLIERFAAQHPQVQWWVDDGSTLPWQDKPANVLQVLGTENYPQLQAFADSGADYILSLDERDGEPLGDTRLHQDARLWPRRMISLSLAQVGSRAGINSPLLKQYCTQHPSHSWYAAGGVRALDDLREAHAIGASGALVATALHQQCITSTELAMLSSRDGCGG